MKNWWNTYGRYAPLVLAIAMIAGVWLFNNDSTGEHGEVHYTSFLSAVEAGSVTSVEIKPDQEITFEMTSDGATPITKTTIGPEKTTELQQLLHTHGVPFKFTVEGILSSESTRSWLFTLLMFLMMALIMRKPLMTAFGNKYNLVSGEDIATTFEDVAGYSEVKAELAEVISFLKNPKDFEKMGAKLVRGVLLCGPSGTGKTLFARAVAGEAGVSFFQTSGSGFIELYSGVGARRVRSLFEAAKKAKSAIIFIDEIDSLGGDRDRPGNPNDEREQTLNQLLVEMDGFEENTGIVVIAATNREESLDPALLRRFSRKVQVPLPTRDERVEIVGVHLRGKPLGDDVSREAIADITSGFSGSALKELINEAALLAIRDSSSVITMKHVNGGVTKITVGLDRRSLKLSDKERRIVAYHELGHALAVLALVGPGLVKKVSIVARGKSLGQMQQVPPQDRYLSSKNDLLIQLAVLLGGRAAESVVFEEISTGATDDINRATSLARLMITQYGMSQKFPHQQLQASPEMPLSEQTMQSVEHEIQQLLAAAFEKVSALIQEKRGEMDQAAAELLAKEELSGDELVALFGLDAENAKSEDDLPRGGSSSASSSFSPVERAPSHY